MARPPRIIAPTFRRSRFGKFGTLPQTIRPTRSEPWREASIQPERGVLTERRKWRYPRFTREDLERRAVPLSQVYGSLEERIVYKELVKRQIPFSFQSSFQGGRTELGGMVADFVLRDRPLIINPLGWIWHSGTANRVRDEVQNDILRRYGYEVLMIWDYDVRNKTAFDRIMSQWLDNPLPPSPMGFGTPDSALRLP